MIKQSIKLEIDKTVYAIASVDYGEDDLADGKLRFRGPPFATEQEALNVFGSHGKRIVQVKPFDAFKILWTWDTQESEWVEV